MHVKAAVSADMIDALLPQTQCRKCGYDGCRPYAEALAAGSADINRCPPGGAEGIADLARLLGMPASPLDPECGAAGPRVVAVIDEARCIGCTLCIQACPVDAIVGAAKLMHTVVRSECTGCELCLPPCPVDCIALIERVPAPDAQARRAEAQRARRRYEARAQRLQKSGKTAGAKAAREAEAESRKRETIQRVMERARLRLAARVR